MRRLKNLLLILTSLTLASCNESVAECINHIDSNHDGKCDVCLKEVPVSHLDENHDGKCDVCLGQVPVNHKDLNHDGKCDVCEADLEIYHEDLNRDCICDVCLEKIPHVDTNNDDHCDVCGAYIHKELDLDSYLITEEWGEGLKDYIAYVLGDENKDMVPQMPAEGGYECYLEDIPYSDGSGSQISCVINCFVADLENAIENYEAILLRNGFYFGSSNYGYQLISATSDLIIQYNVVEVQGYVFLELIIYKAETRFEEWPSEQVSILIGADIPVYECESYEFYYYLDNEDYLPVAVIYDHNTGINGLVDYHKQILATNNYTLVSNTADGYQYLSKDGKIELNIYPTSDEYNRDSIYMTIKNKWPYFYNVLMLGEDIPCFSMEAMEYMFQDLNQDGEAEYLTIFFDGTSEFDFNSYCEQFIRAGWSINELESDDTTKIFVKTINEIEKEILVTYSESRASICVAFKEQ